jgi:uncharacterized protein with NAD-binding domain and iron-sulfur cluster
MASKRRIAILGGGVGALSAAYAITETMNARERFEITVYQQGWRLGGKGASGRNADPANGLARRIEEHGLHVWGGFYDNAFRVMRSAIAESNRTAPGWTFPTFDDAFKPHDLFHLADLENGEWVFNAIRPPSNAAQPGMGGALLGPADYLRMLGEQMREIVSDLRKGPGGLRTIPDMIGTATFAMLRPMVEQLAAFTAAAVPGPAHSAAAGLLAQIAGSLRERAMVHAESDPALRQVLVTLDFMAAAMGGIISDGLVLRGFEAVDDEELSAWLQRHGALDITVRSALVRGVYDYVFGFKHGATVYGARGIAAGTGLRGLLRLVMTYKGAVFWKMQAGMGDTIFTPLYLALRVRGVNFEFFHRVKALRLAEDEKAIGAIEMARQAEVPSGTYQPLIRVPTETDSGRVEIGCWPSAPLYDQLALPEGRKTWDGVDFESDWDRTEVGQRVLRRGEDFDDVVLGISIGGLKPLTTELAAAHPPWAEMLDHVHAVETEALQIWFDRSVEEMGWNRGETIVTGFADPFDTYADMTHLLKAEDWPREGAPRALAYFCAPLDDPPPPPAMKAAPRRRPGSVPMQAEETERVFERAQRWIESELPVIFPGLLKRDTAGGTVIDWSLLHDPEGREGPERLKAQYHRANVSGSEKYVTCGPGTTRFRLPADGTGFSNLTIAGDWVKTAINAGCVEAACMAGMAAARAVSGVPIEIIGEEPPAPAHLPPRTAASTLRAMRAQNMAFPWSVNAGTLTTEGTVIVLWVPRGTAAALLPEGVTPIPQQGMGDAHPIVLLLGTQRDVGARFLPLGLRYDETVLGVPNVQLARDDMPVTGPYVHMSRLWLDQLFPTVLGIAAYGYAKRLARMAVTPSRYSISGLRHGEPILDATLSTEEGNRALEEGGLPDDVRAIFEQPLISQSPLGPWLTSFYDFNLEEAEIRPARVTLRLGAPVLPGLGLQTVRVPPLMPGAWDMAGQTWPAGRPVPRGAFRLRTLATLTSPIQSPALDRLVARR